MSAENGKHTHTTTPSLPSAIKLKRQTSNMLMKNGVLPALPSLAPARDLTLGGRGGNAAKKVFIPNLNVVRNKNATVKTSKDTTARGRGRGRSERGRGGRGGGGNSTLIQTAGVFSEGAGAINLRKTTTSSPYSRSADDAPSALRRPTLIKTEHTKIDSKAEAEHIRELIGDSDEDDFVDDKTDLEQIPIKLNEAKWKYIKPEIKNEIHNNHHKVTNGDVSMTDDSESALAIAQTLQSLHVLQQHQHEKQQRSIGSLPRYPESLTEMFHSTKPLLFVMQLPDTLPCENDDDDSPEKPKKMSISNEAATSSNYVITSPATKTNTKNHSFNNMEEGRIGKLVRYRSGKMKLLLGESYFDVDMGMETGFLQDVMSIAANREERSGNMINLGPIEAKLTATPDWEHLLKQQMSREHA